MDNYYAGGHLDRQAWNRAAPGFLRAALGCPSARFILFRALRPLVVPATRSVALFTWATVSRFLDPEKDLVPVAEVVGDRGALWPLGSQGRSPAIVFLGTQRKSEALSTTSDFHHSVWAIDVTKLSDSTDLFRKLNGELLEFTDLKKIELGEKEASWVGLGRCLLDWNGRNRFCSGCGRLNQSVWAGWKLSCVSTDNNENCNVKRPECFSKTGGVQNFCYPRSDPVSIMAISNPSNNSLLLGRKPGWPEGLYSCLAGFIEPGESIEDSVRREVWEEAGVRVTSVRYHSSQPWPFPGSLMIGVMGESEDNPVIRTDLDNELEDARFFPREVVLKALKSNKSLTPQEIEQIEENQQQQKSDINQPDNVTDNNLTFKLRIPPPTAIAHQLIKSWAFRNSGDKFSDSVKKLVTTSKPHAHF